MGEKRNDDLIFTVSAASRHPQKSDTYDKEAHQYRSEYVHPQQWELNLRAQLPLGWEHCHWEIRAENAAFTEKSSQNQESPNPGHWSVQVPEEGQYHICLKVHMSDGSHRQREEEFQLQDYLFVALGDSYFCGEGSPDVPGEAAKISGSFACNMATFTKFLQEKVGVEVPMRRDPVWQEKLVHRSHRNGPTEAVRALEEKQNGQVITFLNFARSGASIEQGLLAPREDDDWTTIGEVEEAQATVGDRPIDVLLISAGGNDVEYSDRLIDLLRDDLPVVGAGGILGDEALNRQQEYDEVMRLLEELPDKLDRLAAEIAKLNPGHVFITPYPLAQFDVVNEDGEVESRSGCGIFDGPKMEVDGKDAELMKETGKELNATLQEAARKHGWHYVNDIVEGFAGHGRCSDEKYFYSAEESCFTQGDFRGTMHPNLKGYRVYADAIAAAVRAHVFAE